MHPSEMKQADFGTGRKKLGIYFLGLLLCSMLTLVAFGAVMHPVFSKEQTLVFVYAAAFLQFLVQIVCFLRLTTQTEQGVNNILSFAFSILILIVIIGGSLWIMWNLQYYMGY